jgi:outer membrane protein TolC
MVLVSILIITLGAGSALAEELTLDDCIKLALEKNNRVIAAQNQVKLAKGNVWRTFGSFLPRVGVGISSSEVHSYIPSQTYDADTLLNVYHTGLTIDSLTLEATPPYTVEARDVISKSYNLYGSASFVLFNGGSNIFNYFGSRADKKYAEQLAEKSEQDIIYEVKVRYFAYLKALDQLEIAVEAVKRGEEQFKLANSKYEVGSASKSDVLKAQVRFGQEKLGLLGAENNTQTALANLKYLIGLDVNSDATISNQYVVKEYSGTENDALKLGLANHPGLLASEYNLKAAKYGVRSTFGQYFPSLSLSLSKNFTGTKWSEVNDLNREDGSWTFGASLNWDIFTGFSRKRDMTWAKITLSNARAGLHYDRNGVALDIKKSYLDIERSKEALVVAEENVLAAQEDMSLVQEKYNLGAATILELLDAQVNLITAQISKVTAEFDYNLAIAKLENAMGVR